MNDYLYEVVKRLVAFDTVSAKSDRDAMDYIAGELAPRGFKTALQPIELYGVSQAIRPMYGIKWLCHANQ